MKKVALMFFLTIFSVSVSTVALAGYNATHDHHEHHDSKDVHESHVGAIKEAIDLLKDEHPDLAERLASVAEHHENL